MKRWVSATSRYSAERTFKFRITFVFQGSETLLPKLSDAIARSCNAFVNINQRVVSRLRCRGTLFSYCQLFRSASRTSIGLILRLFRFLRAVIQLRNSRMHLGYH